MTVAPHAAAAGSDFVQRNPEPSLGNLAFEQHLAPVDRHRDAAEVEPRRAGDLVEDLGADRGVAAMSGQADRARRCGTELDAAFVKGAVHARSPGLRTVRD